MQSILSEPLQKCPQCGNVVERLISLIAGVLWKGRQMNQYEEVKLAKYWRDHDGNKHLVGPGDGCVNSPTVPRQTKCSPEEVQRKIKRDDARRKKERMLESKQRMRQNRG